MDHNINQFWLLGKISNKLNKVTLTIALTLAPLLSNGQTAVPSYVYYNEYKKVIKSNQDSLIKSLDYFLTKDYINTHSWDTIKLWWIESIDKDNNWLIDMEERKILFNKLDELQNLAFSVISSQYNGFLGTTERSSYINTLKEITALIRHSKRLAVTEKKHPKEVLSHCLTDLKKVLNKTGQTVSSEDIYAKKDETFVLDKFRDSNFYFPDIIGDSTGYEMHYSPLWSLYNDIYKFWEYETKQTADAMKKFRTNEKELSQYLDSLPEDHLVREYVNEHVKSGPTLIFIKEIHRNEQLNREASEIILKGEKMWNFMASEGSDYSKKELLNILYEDYDNTFSSMTAKKHSPDILLYPVDHFPEFDSLTQMQQDYLSNMLYKKDFNNELDKFELFIEELRPFKWLKWRNDIESLLNPEIQFLEDIFRSQIPLLRKQINDNKHFKTSDEVHKQIILIESMITEKSSSEVIIESLAGLYFDLISEYNRNIEKLIQWEDSKFETLNCEIQIRSYYWLKNISKLMISHNYFYYKPDKTNVICLTWGWGHAEDLIRYFKQFWFQKLITVEVPEYTKFIDDRGWENEDQDYKKIQGK